MKKKVITAQQIKLAQIHLAWTEIVAVLNKYGLDGNQVYALCPSLQYRAEALAEGWMKSSDLLLVLKSRGPPHSANVSMKFLIRDSYEKPREEARAA
jgi:hypothetical protein